MMAKVLMVLEMEAEKAEKTLYERVGGSPDSLYSYPSEVSPSGAINHSPRPTTRPTRCRGGC